MNDNRFGGTMLAAGSVAGLITMALHPVAPPGGVLPSARSLETLALLDRAVHGLALAGVAMVFLGALALTRRLAAGDRLALAALVAYGFASVAILSAACLSGFVGADLLSRMAAGDGKLEQWRMLLAYTFRLNQAFAAVYTVGTSAAVFLWSAAMVRMHRPPAGLGIYGLVLGPLTVAALFSGHLSLDVHGFGLVVLTQTVWFVGAGIGLLRDAADEERPQPPSASGLAVSAP